MIRLIMAIIIISQVGLITLADGVMLPVSKNYPGGLLRHRSTDIQVITHGRIVETIVNQEFINEWNQTVDAVYSYPLPWDARATRFLYWYKNQTYQAVLKIKEQSVNPGTGEGGIAALVNDYIGANGIKISLKNIQPSTIQKVELHYIQLADYSYGLFHYTCPLETSDFLTYPLDLLSGTFWMYTSSPMSDLKILDYDGWSINQRTAQEWIGRLSLSKTYLTRDLNLTYRIPSDSMGIDFYCSKNDTALGYFAMLIRPGEIISQEKILPKRIVFLIENSNRVSQTLMKQFKSFVSIALDSLSDRDYFNIGSFHSDYSFSFAGLEKADPANLSVARQFIASVVPLSGVNLQSALIASMNQFPDSLSNNIIMVFTTGFSALDMDRITQLNQKRISIFPVGFGSDVDRKKLEMLAYLNYGSVTFWDDEEDASSGLVQVFRRIHRPIFRNVRMELTGIEIIDQFPERIPDVYDGTSFLLTGRYRNSGTHGFSIGGYDYSQTPQSCDFILNFPESGIRQLFVENLWAKEKIDDLERKIACYGETDSLKNELIQVSLRYGIRCKYTSYWTDYQTLADLDEAESENTYCELFTLLGNYPNPFHTYTTIRFSLSLESMKKNPRWIRIYNMIGQLIQQVDLSSFPAGTHVWQFQADRIPSGIYFVQMRVGRESQVIKMQCLK